ncbi:MAG: hypothetical protein LIO95_07215 [Clostridiales bacterium]|nr:hypothetical protein [Clostridiales bacterium]
MSNSLPAPITRADCYLATLCGVYSGDLPAPITREDLFLLYLLVANDSIADGQIVRGRNYLPNTRTMDGWLIDKDVITLTTDDEGYTVATWAATDTLGWHCIDGRDPIQFSSLRGQTVTLSLDIRADDYASINASTSRGCIVRLVLCTSDSNTITLYRNIDFRTVTLSDSWQRISRTVTLTDDYFSSGSGSIDDTTRFYIEVFDYSLYSMQVRKAKLEIGDTATSWTPAVEDGELPTPITRADRYLAYLCGTYAGTLPAPITRKDYYLAALCGTYDGDLPTPIMREDYYLSQLVAAGGVLYEDKTASGVSVEVADAAAQPLNSLVLYGWSTQATTTGAQLLDLSSCTSMTAYELETIIDAENGIITIQGTPTGNSSSNLSYRFLAPTTVFDGKVFTPETLQQDGVASFYIYVATAGSSPLAINMTLTSVDAEIYLRFRLMVADAAADWEPYTGGVVSPSPDYPQEITSAADSGEIAVTVADGSGNSQTLILAAENGLPGIPVSSGGNYTDANGQQWIADEIVLNADGTGTYRAWIWSANLNGDEDWLIYNYSGLYGGYVCEILPEKADRRAGYCSALPISTEAHTLTAEIWIGVNNFYLYALTDQSEIGNNDLAEWKAYLAENPMTVMTYLSEPVETALTADEIAAFLALKAYNGTTIITNDADAYMEVGYKSKKE